MLNTFKEMAQTQLSKPSSTEYFKSSVSSHLTCTSLRELQLRFPNKPKCSLRAGVQNFCPFFIRL